MVKYRYILIFSFLVVIIFNLCNNKDCDYSDCLPSEPYESTVTIKVTINEENPKVPIFIYKGRYNQTDELIYSDTAKEEYYKIILPLNHYYYVKAKYQKNSDTIYAIDGVFFKKFLSQECDSSCWKIKNNIINVKLK